MKRFIRFSFLAVYFLHLGAIVVLLRRGMGAGALYLKEMYRASKINAGAYLPVVPVEEIVNVPVAFNVYRPEQWICSMTVSEVATLCYLVAFKKPRKILEVGTFRGLTTLNLALNAPQAQVHTVDITDTWGSYYYKDYPGVTNIKQHYGDSATYDLANNVGDGIDFCLIDGGHSYEQVRGDTLQALPLMSDDGMLFWDDYGRNDFFTEVEPFKVSQFMHEIQKSGVQVLHGTSVAWLQLSRETKQELLAYLKASSYL